MRIVLAAGLLPFLFQFGGLFKTDYFVPANKLSGIGVDREQISDAVLNRRSELMVASQTFSIMRDPQALEGAQRITGPKLKRIFADASKKSGLPISLISAVAYLESWGNAAAQSPAGPKGVMQIAGGTARDGPAHDLCHQISSRERAKAGPRQTRKDHNQAGSPPSALSGSRPG